MTILQDLEDLAEDELCHECSTPLTNEEKEVGFVCGTCIHGWLDEAVWDEHTQDNYEY